MNPIYSMLICLVFATLSIRSEYVCKNYENDIDFKDDNSLTLPLNGNLDECTRTCSSLGADCSGLTYEYSTTNCYLKKFTQPNRVAFPGSNNDLNLVLISTNIS